MRPRPLLAWCTVLVVTTLAPASIAAVFHSQREALEIAFPDAEIREQTWILSAEQTQRIEKLARSKLESEIVTLHSGWWEGKLLGHAFIEVHNVRTKAEAFMVVMDPAGTVKTVMLLAFHEPLDYMPTQRWYQQFGGKTLADGLRVGRDLHGVVGATLSTRAVSEGVRRALAIHRVLVQNGTTLPEAAP
jgi:hypothetical protein